MDRLTPNDLRKLSLAQLIELINRILAEVGQRVAAEPQPESAFDASYSTNGYGETEK